MIRLVLYSGIILPIPINFIFLIKVWMCSDFQIVSVTADNFDSVKESKV